MWKLHKSEPYYIRRKYYLCVDIANVNETIFSNYYSTLIILHTRLIKDNDKYHSIILIVLHW